MECCYGEFGAVRGAVRGSWELLGEAGSCYVKLGAVT